MQWSAPTLWWLAAGVLVAVEMATGTFYLLMLALGVVAGAIAAHAGLGLSAQLVAAAVVGGGAIVGWHLHRRGRPGAGGGVNRNFDLDIGEQVHVARWEPDGTARVDYRGAQWNARYAGDGEPSPGPHIIRGIEANRLLLGR